MSSGWRFSFSSSRVPFGIVVDDLQCDNLCCFDFISILMSRVRALELDRLIMCPAASVTVAVDGCSLC